jgi:hypothetical protein
MFAWHDAFPACLGVRFLAPVLKMNSYATCGPLTLLHCVAALSMGTA